MLNLDEKSPHHVTELLRYANVYTRNTISHCADLVKAVKAFEKVLVFGY